MIIIFNGLWTRYQSLEENGSLQLIIGIVLVGEMVLVSTFDFNFCFHAGWTENTISSILV